VHGYLTRQRRAQRSLPSTRWASRFSRMADGL